MYRSVKTVQSCQMSLPCYTTCFVSNFELSYSSCDDSYLLYWEKSRSRRFAIDIDTRQCKLSKRDEPATTDTVKYFGRIYHRRGPAVVRRDQSYFRDKSRQRDWTSRFPFCCQCCSDCMELHACIGVMCTLPAYDRALPCVVCIRN